MSISDKLNELVTTLDTIESRKHQERGFTHPADKIHLKYGRKYCNIDIGGSGAWMVELSTGEIYNIKAYGVPDKNKKQKADVGNIWNVDPEVLHSKRYNYLR